MINEPNKEKVEGPAPQWWGFELELHGGNPAEKVRIDFGNEDGSYCKLVLHLRERQVIGRDWSFWHTLITIRKQLEPEELIPVCYGTSLDV
jgi:hypothetical protein